MPRVSKEGQELGYVRSFWNEVREVQAVYGVAVEVAVHLSERPGVLVFRIKSTSVLDTSGEGMGTNAVQFEFPTAGKSTLAAALWVHAMKLEDLCAEQATKKAARQAKRKG